MVAELKMNQEKLKMLQAQVRIGGKGTVRRKKKVVHRTATTDDKKLQSSLKKLSVNNIPGIEEVNMIKDDGTVIHFNNPKVQASLAANTFAVTGHAENKQITEMLPGILNQLGAESLTHLKRLASNVSGGPGMGGMEGTAGALDEEEDDEVPDLVENFDEVSKDEKATESCCKTESSCGEKKEESPIAEAPAVTEVAAAPEALVESAAEAVVESAPEAVVESAPEAAVESTPEAVVETTPEPAAAAPEPAAAAPEAAAEAAPEPAAPESAAAAPEE